MRALSQRQNLTRDSELPQSPRFWVTASEEAAAPCPQRPEMEEHNLQDWAELFRSLLCCSLGERYPLWACFTTLRGGDGFSEMTYVSITCLPQGGTSSPHHRPPGARLSQT